MNETEMDRLERKEREFNLNRIREQDEKRQAKIANYGHITPEKAKHRGNSHLKTQYQTPNIISDCERINRKCPDCGNWFIVPMQLCDLKPKLRSKCEQKKKRMVNE